MQPSSFKQFHHSAGDGVYRSAESDETGNCVVIITTSSRPTDTGGGAIPFSGERRYDIVVVAIY